MSQPSDFIIENGVLLEYVGTDFDVVIPDGVVRIGPYAFSEKAVTTKHHIRSVKMPDSVEYIDNGAFVECHSLSEVEFSPNVKEIGGGAFNKCTSIKKIVLPPAVKRVGDWVFWGHYGFNNKMIPQILEIHSSELVFPSEKLSFFYDKPKSSDHFHLFAPHLPLTILKNHGLAMPAAVTFMKRYTEYDAPITKEYVDYVASQKKKLLPLIYKDDNSALIQLLYDAKKITKKNFGADYLQPAKQCKATKCVELLTKLFGDAAEETAVEAAPVNPLWDGQHFSIDGKQLLKYPNDQKQDVYHVPEGTTTIAQHAFYLVPLKEIYLPETVTTIRKGAFIAHSDTPLFIKLPNSLKKLPADTIWGGVFLGETDINCWLKSYYVSTSSPQFAAQFSADTASKGLQCPVYTGGPLDDLPAGIKSFAVRGYLYATEHGLEDLSQWKDGYIKHIKTHEKTYLKYAEENPYLLHLMLNEKLLSAKGVEALLKSPKLADNVDAQSALLTYQNEHFTKKASDVDPLADDAADIKRAIKKAERQEQLKAQKGIAGVTFVASGELENFGFTDEYTGARDRDDLKEFIEARGGFLRSAVSSKTDYLICNFPSTQTTKVKKAQELGITIITEEEFLDMAEAK